VNVSGVLSNVVWITQRCFNREFGDRYVLEGVEEFTAIEWKEFLKNRV